MGLQAGADLLRKKRATDTASYQGVWGKRRECQAGVNPKPIERAIPGHRKGKKRADSAKLSAIRDVDQRVKEHLDAPLINNGDWMAVDPEKSYLRDRLRSREED